MNEFIEKNRRLLEFYHFTAHIIGWILIAMAPIIVVRNLSRTPAQSEFQLYTLLFSIRAGILNFILFGLIVLGISRLIRYLYEEQSQPGWILRHIEKFLYIYALLIVVGFFIEFKHPSIHIEQLALYLLPQIIHKAAQVLILIGLGHIIRRILPVIEESKTLI